MGSNPTPSANPVSNDEAMLTALNEAHCAATHEDVPVGAVIVHRGRIISAAHNKRELLQDPLAHAEIIALTSAARVLGRWKLDDCTLFTTLEPCVMCAGAIVGSRLRNVYVGLEDPQKGAMGSVYNFAEDVRLGPRVSVTAGLHRDSSQRIIESFFSKLRNR